MPMTVLNESALISALQSGDHAAYATLYEKFWRSLYIHAYKRVKDEAAAKDIIQNVFINIWQRRETIRIHTEIEHYLNGAVRFQVFNYFRSEKIKDKVLESTIQRFEEMTTINNLDGYFELEKIIAGEVALLPDKMKEAYLLKAAQHSTAEIAQKLNLKEQTVSNHLSEALRRIRVKLGSKYPEWVILAFFVIELNWFIIS
ncbi:RNA polymerase sigma factor [Pedobacter gandavensis]|uniref:RNA polymerase sigma factor SigS n=1 Tax=Pedobacter gandavensis TaxID=2679963 RepID=A0ABR6ETT5_9SPHI|nr:sigma-70 family RNA polymerase sigma factor [Pedobacter gandavensis]MBB2148683.1 sigma-70 family RNA polymerase sigma factor [Pedobacter gandavensis]